MAASGKAQKQAMEASGPWFATVDGGNPVGASSTVLPDGSVANDGGANPVTGYSPVEAKDRDDALAKAKGRPILANGGSVEVAETFEP